MVSKGEAKHGIITKCILVLECQAKILPRRRKGVIKHSKICHRSPSHSPSLFPLFHHPKKFSIPVFLFLPVFSLGIEWEQNDRALVACDNDLVVKSCGEGTLHWGQQVHTALISLMLGGKPPVE